MKGSKVRREEEEEEGRGDQAKSRESDIRSSLA